MQRVVPRNHLKILQASSDAGSITDEFSSPLSSSLPAISAARDRERQAKRTVIAPASLAFIFLTFCWMLLPTNDCSAADADQRPNVVLIFTDDLGYGDINCFTPTQHRTPNIDALASQGTRFTDFYVAQAVCTASRAALMTGCYANRVGLAGALNHTSRQGISREERLLPQIFSQQGYRTAMFGKWHLGLSPYFSPLRHGFDQWFGIPYSNDNTKYHPVLADSMPPLPLYAGDANDEKILELDPDQSLFTRRITERAVEFIEQNREEPFFLYVPHVMPHVPIFASDAFQGKSGAGLYGDVIEELDWSVGQIVDCVDRLGLTENTWIIFTSDNGPFLSYGAHAGSTGPLREGKLNTFEGGVRVPTVMRWPGVVPVNQTCRSPLMSIDLLPTVCRILGTDLPDNPIDGIDVLDTLRGESQPLDQRPLVFYAGNELQAVRWGKWKLHFAHQYLTPIDDYRDDGRPAGYGKLKPKSITESGIEGIASRHGYRVELLPLTLFDLSADIGETTNLAEQHPEVVRQIDMMAEVYRQELGDSLTNRVGQNVRPVGMRPADPAEDQNENR